MPDGLKQKISQIQMNGGKMKLDMEVKILTKNSEQALMRFKDFKKRLSDEEAYYKQKVNQYGNSWRTQPSNLLNRQYFNDI